MMFHGVDGSGDVTGGHCLHEGQRGRLQLKALRLGLRLERFDLPAVAAEEIEHIGDRELGGGARWVST